MATLTEHLQYDEVLQRLNAERACAIVEPNSRREVVVWADRKTGWAAQATIKDKPSAEVKSQLAAHRFRVERDERAIQMTPNLPMHVVTHRVYGEFPDAPSAARAGLALFHILWSVPGDEWLWVTAIEFEKRGTAQRPATWPAKG